MKRKNDDSTSLTTSVYQQFRDKMMALEIKPGSRLIEEDIAKEITAKTDALAPTFYNDEDRKNGYMVSTNRKGEVEKFKFLSIGIGIVHNTKRPLTSFAMVSNIGSELKCLAKKYEDGSFYVMDRRA